MIDTHAHIDTEAFDEDRQVILERAFAKGLEHIIIPAIEPKGFDKLIEVSALDPRLSCSIGLHPHNALEAGEKTYTLIEEYAANPKAVAIGEIGLDYFYDFAPPDVQKEVFARQLRIAKALDLPVIIHNREADEDILEILTKEQDGSLKGVLHCFSSSVEIMKRAVGLGFNISFTGNITFKKTNLGEVVSQVPEGHFMIETDSPYMTPVPYRGRRNEPANVEFIAKKIAEYKSISFEKVIEMTTKTARELFRLGIVLIVCAMSLVTAFAQDDTEGEDEAGEKEQEIKIHPYNKFIGLGFYAASNTIIETFYTDDNADGEPRTYEGVLAFGGGLFYQPLDYLVVEATYMHSKNTDDIYHVEYVYRMIEATAHWIPNPYSRINVFATTGVTFLFNSTPAGDVNHFGLNGGVGFYGNLPIRGVGLFNIAAEWRLTFVMGRQKAVDPQNPIKNSEGVIIGYKPVETSQFFSLPRIGLIFYPDFLGR